MSPEERAHKVASQYYGEVSEPGENPILATLIVRAIREAVEEEREAVAIELLAAAQGYYDSGRGGDHDCAQELAACVRHGLFRARGQAK